MWQVSSWCAPNGFSCSRRRKADSAWQASFWSTQKDYLMYQKAQMDSVWHVSTLSATHVRDNNSSSNSNSNNNIKTTQWRLGGSVQQISISTVVLKLITHSTKSADPVQRCMLLTGAHKRSKALELLMWQVSPWSTQRVSPCNRKCRCALVWQSSSWSARRDNCSSERKRSSVTSLILEYTKV